MKVVVLGMGGTIAGVGDVDAPRGYRSGEVPIDALVAGAALPEGVEVRSEQVSQVDSKDMDEVLWSTLARRVAYWVAQHDVAGVVVTHGTDTLEETAYFLAATLDPSKPVVLTGSMYPSTHATPDGPANLRDALATAAQAGLGGIYVVFAGRLFQGSEVRKVHPSRPDAFEAGDAGCLARVQKGSLIWERPARPGDPAFQPGALEALVAKVSRHEPMPWVAWINSHAGATGAEVRALVAAGVRGLVVGGTGNASLHHLLEDALAGAAAAGIPVEVGSRCGLGDAESVVPGSTRPALPPAKARIAMQLRLLAS
ncbi:asparaginase [Xylophilus sp. Kf1]|nr:asparaginase [Xylophilus sp. Kf1]